MKALPFIELYRAEKFPRSPLDYLPKDEAIERYFNLVSQPFKPDMIVELFEGWGKDKYAVDTYYKGEESYEFRIGFDGDERIRYHKNKACYFNREELPIPTTIDQFITDCQRANIELHFKEEIVTKYFR